MQTLGARAVAGAWCMMAGCLGHNYYYAMGAIIRKYGSTFYIGIAMVVLPYFGLWEKI